jgi:hypothetical protein
MEPSTSLFPAAVYKGPTPGELISNAHDQLLSMRQACLGERRSALAVYMQTKNNFTCVEVLSP